jgi:hypothetical protein
MTDIKSRDLIAALRARFRQPAWAFFEEVRDATGYAARRTADAIALSCWPSRGLELWGFEVKVSRGDWRREAADPEKGERILGYCDRVFVVAPRNVVPLEELPPKWGLMELHGSMLRAVRPADLNGEARPLDRLFMASLMREAFRYIEHAIADADATKQAYERGRKEAEDAAAFALDRASRDHKSLTEAVAAFTAASGVAISPWNAGEVGAAVKVVLRGGHRDICRRLRALKEDIDAAVAALGAETT